MTTSQLPAALPASAQQAKGRLLQMGVPNHIRQGAGQEVLTVLRPSAGASSRGGVLAANETYSGKLACLGLL